MNKIFNNLKKFVTKESGTEPAFNNAYWDEKKPGIYVDINTKKALFSSLDKYDSGTGWPSFTKPIKDSKIEEKLDLSQGMIRKEVKTESSHLGHVFSDGPKGNKRFCINSAALKFIPYENLEEEGYSEYKKIFPYKEIVLAGGCFWGVEHLLEKQPGVISAISGYANSDIKNPKYKEVSSGKANAKEAVRVIYDNKKTSLKKILDIFWRLHNPTELNRQGPDIGSQYASVIFYSTEEQKRIAQKSKKEFDSKKVFKKPVVTEITKLKNFYKAEDWNQNYVKNHPDYTCHTLREE